MYLMKSSRRTATSEDANLIKRRRRFNRPSEPPQRDDLKVELINIANDALRHKSRHKKFKATRKGGLASIVLRIKPQVGFEPTNLRLTEVSSPCTELPRLPPNLLAS